MELITLILVPKLTWPGRLKHETTTANERRGGKKEKRKKKQQQGVGSVACILD